ncbi:TPA: restriction endonuclease subunit S [Escherichia coli]|nr:restriction endonuclease subunit S [Escherichia coli]
MSKELQYRIVPSSWLGRNGRRLDCNPYVSGAIEARELMSAFQTESLQVLTDGIYHAGREGRQYVFDLDYGVPFLGSTDILASDLSYQPLLSKKQIDRNPNFTIREKWTLITRSGTTGRMAYARKAMDGVACSEHVMRVVPAQDKVPPGYIYAYLSSRFGVPLVVSGTYGSIIQSIEPHHIADLPVPRLGEVENTAHGLVEESANLLTESQEKLNEATALFFNSVGLTDISPTEWRDWGSDLGFTATAVVQSLRALNFCTRFNRLYGKIKQGPWRTLGELCIPGTLKRGSRFNRVDAEPEYAYKLVGQKELFWLRPEGRWIAKKYVPDDVLVEQGSILVAARGTLGEGELYCRSEFISGRMTENAYSEDILRVIGNEDVIERGALFAFMRSETAFRMLRSISVGSKLQDHHYMMLPLLPVPYPPADIRTRCNELVLEAYEARGRAIELEDEARLLVERTIEEGGR